ncbi:MAG: hypothetical protein WBC93_04750 [Sulfitobacter sp.]
MTRAIAILALATLTACGADGEPVRPSVNGSVSVSNHGVHTGASVGLSKGPLSIFLGL